MRRTTRKSVQDGAEAFAVSVDQKREPDQEKPKAAKAPKSRGKNSKSGKSGSKKSSAQPVFWEMRLWERKADRKKEVEDSGSPGDQGAGQE